MPTNLNQGRTSWSYDFPEFIATEEGLRSPRAITVDLNFVTENADKQRIIKPGHLLSVIDLTNPNSFGRLFPASRATVAAIAGVTTITVKDAGVFRVGDQLRLGFTGASNLGTVSAVNLTNNTLTVSATTAALAIGGIVNAIQGGDIANVLGFVVSAIDINKAMNDVAAYTSASVYLKRAQIWTPELQTALPEITSFRPVPVADYP